MGLFKKSKGKDKITKCPKCKTEYEESEAVLSGADSKIKIRTCPKCGEGEVDKETADKALKERDAKNISKALIDMELLKRALMDLTSDDLDKMQRKINCDEPIVDAMSELFFNQPLKEFDE